jgi:hypothetical protein
VADLPQTVQYGAVRATLERHAGALRIVVRRGGPTTVVGTLGDAPDGLARIRRGRVDERFETPSGKRREHRLRARRMTVRFGPRSVEVIAAADGAAFRTRRLGPTTYRLPRGTRSWLQNYRTDYERSYVERALERQRYGLPALLRRRSTYTLLTESGVGDGPVSHLEGGRVVPDTKLWRVAITGSLADVVESDLALSLGRPSEIADTSWIEPGVAAWSWWSDRRSGARLDAQKAFVDAAAANGWRYVTVDAGWDPAWIPELVSYAKERGVAVILWYDVDDADIDQAADLGAAGVKLDFVLSDRRDRIALMDALARQAARRRLVVDFHGCTIPRGLQRTWPNVLSLEAVQGAEYWSQEPASPAHNVNLAFTRNVIGGMDYTPVTFSAPGRVTSLGHELAESVVFESGLQHFADAPSSYAAEPLAERVLREVPVAWDDTRLVSGEPDDHAVLARRDGDAWWVGGLFAGAPRTARVPLDFLGDGDYAMRLVADGLTDIEATVTARTVLQIPVELNGGFVIELRP